MTLTGAALGVPFPLSTCSSKNQPLPQKPSIKGHRSSTCNPVLVCSSLFPTLSTSNIPFLSVGVKTWWVLGLQPESAEVIKELHASIWSWVMQFHGLLDLTGEWGRKLVRGGLGGGGGGGGGG